MIRASILKMGALPTYRPGEAYNPDALGVGTLMIQKNEGADSFVGPLPITVLRPMEASVPFAQGFPAVMKWSDKSTSQWDWVFTAENGSAAATRRLAMSRYDRLTGQPTYDGFVTVTFPGTSEAKTVRALRLDYMAEKTGTVAVTGTAVAGTGTKFKTNRICAGNRIGFGSVDPDAIVQWYEIESIASDGALTLTTALAEAIPAGTPYVVEDLRLRLLLAVSSVTVALGGLYIIKGLRREIFSSVGTVIPAATTVDNIRACYFLKDAATGNVKVPFGMGQEDGVDATLRNLWMLETLANPLMFKFNIRAALTVVAGASVSAFTFKTGAGGVLTGVPSQMNNGRMANTAHGPGAGKDCVYFTTTTRVYRTADVSTITDGSTAWLIDNMTEVPPGSINTFALTSALQSIEYTSALDRFVLISSGSAGARSYLTQYRTDGGQMDRIIFADFKQSDQGAADNDTTPFPSQIASSFSVWIEGGMAYLLRLGTTAILNQLYFVPLGADWEFAATTGSRVIFPRLRCQDSTNFLQAFTQAITVLGGASGKNLGMSPQPHRIYYRTAGIDNNSGGWNLVPPNGDMSATAGAPYVQFMAEFRIDNTMIPARILGIGVIFNDSTMSVNWQASGNVGTSLALKQFGFRHAVAYGGTVPRLLVEVFDAESGSSLGVDDSVTKGWTWQKSVDGGTTWAAYNSNDRANADTYIRVTPPSLADNIKVRVVLREY